VRVIVFVALRQLWARRGLNAIAVGGVALGVLVLVSMTAIMAGFQREFTDNILRAADHVVIHDRKLASDLPLLSSWLPGPLLGHVRHEPPSDRPQRIVRPADTLRMIRALPEVTAACGQLNGQAVVSFGQRSQGASIHGIQADEVACAPIAGYVREGAWAQFVAGRDGILFGSLFAEKLGVRLGDRVTVVAPDGGSTTLKVAGIFEVGVAALDRAWLFVPLAAAQGIFGQPSAISNIGVRTADPDGAEALAERLEHLTGYDAESWQELNAATLSVFGVQNTVVGFQIGAILVVGGFGILAIQIMIVIQKTRDIAILRSVGFRRRDILSIFLMQGAAVAALGAALGDLLGWRFIAYLDSKYDPSLGYKAVAQLRVEADPRAYLWGALFALIIGMLASMIPAWRGGRVEPVDVLRGQLG
jgi:lipoprotein-releasing system permease protein